MESLRRLLALVVKEFLALLKDPKSRTVVVIPPLFQTLVFGYAATFDLNNVPYAVYDEDGGAAAADLRANIEGSPNFQLVRSLDSDHDIPDLINSRKVALVVRIPPTFTRDINDNKAVVQAIVDGRNSNTASIVLNYLTEIITSFNNERMEQRGQSPPSRLAPRAWFNENYLSQWFFVPGIVAVVTMVVTVLVTALSVAREREQGTFDQLLVTPLRPLDILIGKAAPGFLIGMAEASVIVLLAVYWFKTPLRGDLLALYIGLVLFLFSAVGIGLMISSFSVTLQQGLLGMFIFAVPAVILSGFATPIANMSPAVQYLTLINPLRYILIIIRGVFLEAAPLRLLWPQLWPLAVIGLMSMVMAAWMFRRRIY
ncbi:MAG: ABC transporter permease [Desulfovibrionaceae bacterium]